MPDPSPLASAGVTGQPGGKERSRWLDLRSFWLPALIGVVTAEASLVIFLGFGFLGFYSAVSVASFWIGAAWCAAGLGFGLFFGWTRTYHPWLARRIFPWEAWKSVVLGILAVYFGVLFLIELGRLGVYRLDFAEAQVAPLLSPGFTTSLELVGVIIPLGFGIGFLVGWARTTQVLILRGFAAYYVDFFRSMPPFALIFFANLIGTLALVNTSLDFSLVRLIALWLGAIALAFHTAAYQAEIVRAGILSVPAGQGEAADSVGVSRMRSMFVVTLPQAFRISLPALGNEFSSVIKDTSLLYIIGWFELTGVAEGLSAAAYSVWLYGSLVIWIEVAFLYFVLTYLVTRTVRVVEDLFKVPGLEVARI